MLLPDASSWRSGDIGFSHGTGIIAKGIRFAEKREGSLGSEPDADTDINHAFALYKKTPLGQWLVIQAEIKGVTTSRVLGDVAPGGYYRIHQFPDAMASRSMFLEFLEAQIHDEYSLMEIGSCALDMYLPEKVSLRKTGTWICSGLVTAGLMYAGYRPVIRLGDIYSNTPTALELILPG